MDVLVLGRDLCGDWHTASRREWLVTNNLGGFAAGTVAGADGTAVFQVAPTSGSLLFCRIVSP